MRPDGAASLTGSDRAAKLLDNPRPIAIYMRP